MKKGNKLSLLFILLLGFCPTLLTSCSPSRTYKTLADVNGSPVACPEASPSFSNYLKNVVPDSKIVYYKTFADCIYSVEHGITAGFVCDDPTYKYIRYNEHNRVIKLDEPVASSKYGFVFKKSSSHDDLLINLNTYLVTHTDRLAQLANKWFPNDYDATKDAKVDEIAYYSSDEAVGSFKAYIIDINAPFGFNVNGQAQGYDADVLINFAKEAKYNITIEPYSATSIFAELDAGKCDIIGGGYNITPERELSYVFSAPNFIGDIDFVVFDPNTPSSTNPFVEGFYKTFIEEDRWKTFLYGAGITLLITIISALVGTFLGYGLYILGLNNKVCRAIINGLTVFFARTPVAVILMIFYYIFFGSSGIPAAWVSVITFTIAYSLTMNGLIKHGTDTIEKNQFDSMYALGYTRTKGFNKVILPQAIRNFAPNYADEIVSLIKGTSIVGFISVIDLTKATDLVRAASFQTFFPLITSAVIYFLLATLLIVIVRAIDKAINPYHKHEVEIRREEKKCSK